MQELLKAQYGEGYHIKALYDIYQDRKYSQAISISTNIVQQEYTEDHQKQAWETISVSLNTAFKNTTVDIIQTASIDTIVKSGVSVPSYLDEMQSRLKLGLIADGNALKTIVDWVYARIQAFWDYLKNVLGLADGDAKAETNTFFSSMSKWFKDAITLFESTAHKIMNGLLQIVETIRVFLYEAGKKAMEYLYGSMEVLFKTSEDIATKRSITNMGFYIVTFMSNIAEYMKEDRSFTQSLTENFAKKVVVFNTSVIENLKKHQTSFNSKESWLLENVSFETIILYLPWLNTLIENVKSFSFSIFGTLSLAGPLLDTLIGPIFEPKETPPVQGSSFELNRLQKEVEFLKKSPNVPDEYKNSLEQSLYLIKLAKSDLTEKRDEFREAQYRDSNVFNTDVANLLTSAYYDEELDLELINKVMTSKTGYDMSQLYLFTQSVNEYVSANILRAQIGALLQKNIGGGLTQKEESELERLKNKKISDLTKDEQSRLLELVKKQSDAEIFSSVLDPSFEDEFDDEDKRIILELKEKGVEKITDKMETVALKLNRSLKAIAEMEEDMDLTRTSHMKSALEAFVTLKGKAARSQTEVTDKMILDSGMSMKAYQIILNNAKMHEYMLQWQNVYTLHQKYNRYIAALNLKKAALDVKKGNAYFITAILAVILPALLYAFILMNFTDRNSGDIFTAREVATQVITQKKGWFGRTYPVTSDVIDLVRDQLVVPGVRDALDIRTVWAYAVEATQGGLLTWTRAPKYVQLLSMLWALGPAVHSVFLFMWFFLCSSVFLVLEKRETRYHEDGRHMVNSIRNLGGSASATAQKILVQMGLLFLMNFTAQADNFMAYGSIGIGLIGSFMSLNPLSMLSGAMDAGKEGIRLTKERYQKAMETRFSFSDLRVSKKIASQIFPMNPDDETKQIPLLTMVELLELKNVASPLEVVAKKRITEGKTFLIEDKDNDEEEEEEKQIVDPKAGIKRQTFENSNN